MYNAFCTSTAVYHTDICEWPHNFSHNSVAGYIQTAQIVSETERVASLIARRNKFVFRQKNTFFITSCTLFVKNSFDTYAIFTEFTYESLWQRVWHDICHGTAFNMIAPTFKFIVANNFRSKHSIPLCQNKILYRCIWNTKVWKDGTRTSFDVYRASCYSVRIVFFRNKSYGGGKQHNWLQLLFLKSKTS